jgi:hypothetical protein
MAEFTREQWHAYLDDALTEVEMARMEQALRESDSLRRALRQAMQERDRGEHSLGAIWRRERLTCPTREDLSSYLFQVHDEARQEYIDFHLQTVACPYCAANLADLRARQKETEGQAKERRKRFFTSSAGYLQVSREPKKPLTER